MPRTTPMRGRPRGIISYGAAVASVLLCLAIRASMLFLGQDYAPFMFFTPAVLFSAWFGGSGPACLAWALGLFLGDYLYTGPRYMLGPFGPGQIDQILVYSLNSFLGSYLILRLRRYGKKLEQEIVSRVQIQSELLQAQDRLLHIQEELREQAARLEQTVQERTRHLQQTIEHLQSIVYHLTHDVRAPLRTMSSFAALIKMRWAPRAAHADQNWPDIIIESATRLDTLVTELLEFGRLGYGTVPLTSVNPEQEVTAVLKDLAFQIQESHAAVVVDSPLLAVTAHPRSLYLVLLNLILNALKFVQAGAAPEIHVWTEAVGERVKIWVEDKGIGFTPEQAERIFKIFERLNEESYQGHGMGLAIAEKAVIRMGGEIGALSEPGKGSRFWISLPGAASTVPAAAA